MSDRGDYRSIYVSFWDDADVHALSDRAYRVLTTMKGTLPPSGIGVVYTAQLAQRCATTVPRIESALVELEQPKAGQRLGWIRRERNIVWIVNALRYEPTLAAQNAKHRVYVARLLAPLGEHVAIVEQFRAYYADWFPGLSHRADNRKGNGTGNESLSDGSDREVHTQSDRVSKHVDVDVNSHSTFQSPELPPALAVDVTGANPDATATTATTDAPVVLVAAANRGIRERFGEQPSPIRHSAGSTHEAAQAIADAGVPIAFARDAVFTCARECSLDRAPRSLKYFVGFVIDRWHASQEYATASGSDAKALVSTNGANGHNADHGTGSFVDAVKRAQRAKAPGGSHV